MADRNHFADTRSVLQIEAAECGAACLSMVLQYYGQYVPLEQLRIETDVSRDGCSAGNIVRAAQRRALQCDGYQMEAVDLVQLQPPCILWWDHNHFVVYEGRKKGFYFINDPAYGKRRIEATDLEEHFSGIVLSFSPEPEFRSFPEYGVKPRTYLRSGRVQDFMNSHRLQVVSAVIAGWASTAAGLAAALIPLGFFGRSRLTGIWSWALLLALFLVVYLIGKVSSDRLLQRLENVNELQMSWRFLHRLFYLPVFFLEQRSPGDMVERVRRNDRISRFTANDIPASIVYLGSILLCLLFTGVRFDPAVAAVITAALILAFVLQVLQERFIKRDRTRTEICDAALGETILSATGKLETIRNLNLDHKYSQKAIQLQDESIQLHKELRKTSLIATVVRYIIYSLCLMAVLQILLIAPDIPHPGPGPGPEPSFSPEILRINLSIVFACMVILLMLIPPMESLLSVYRKIHEIDDEFGSVDDIANRELVKSEHQPGYDSREYRKLQGNIRCHRVAFSYGAFGEKIVEGLNLYLPVGSSLAVTGPSGSGKTTIGKLFGGLLTPSEGVIMYDKTPMGEIPERVIYASIEMVEQKSRLFAGSIIDNITMWNPNITADDVQDAIEDACLEECIASRTDGVQTVLGDHGAGLSGGEQQRLEIARALAANPTILILDEAFSAIDDETTEQIMSNIRRRGCTCIVITHDPVLIHSCSQRLDLNEGGGES